MKPIGIGFFYVLSVPYVAAIGSISGFPTAGGFEYTGWIWVILCVLGPLLIFYKKARITFPYILWILWFGYVWLSVLWVEGWERANFQDALQITMPLIIGSVASVFVRDDRQLRMLRKSFNYSVLILVFIFAVLSFGELSIISANRRTMALTAVFFTCIFVGSRPLGIRQCILGSICCLAIAFLSQSRMATFAILIIWGVYPWHRRLSKKIYGVILLSGIAMALFYTSTFQERFFGVQGGRGSLSDVIAGNFDSAGRFEVWPEIWSESKKHILAGVGVGEIRDFLVVAWPDINKPHNDYLRIIYEQGFIGLLCFAVVILTQINILRRKLKIYEGELRYAFAASYLGLIGLLVIMITDNAILYNTWYLNPLFAVLGSAYGAASHQPKKIENNF